MSRPDSNSGFGPVPLNTPLTDATGKATTGWGQWLTKLQAIASGQATRRGSPLGPNTNIQELISDFLYNNLSVTMFGAVGDGQKLMGAGSMTAGSANLTVAGGAFDTTDVGLTIVVQRAGVAHTVSITSATAANPAVLQTSAPHGLFTNCTLAITGGTGAWAALNGNWTIGVLDSTHIVIGALNSTGFGALAGTVTGNFGARLKSTIKSVTDATHIVLSNVAVSSVSAAGVFWGTDNTQSLQAAIDYASTNSVANDGPIAISVPPGVYLHDTLTISRPIRLYGSMGLSGAATSWGPSSSLLHTGDATDDAIHCEWALHGSVPALHFDRLSISACQRTLNGIHVLGGEEYSYRMIRFGDETNPNGGFTTALSLMGSDASIGVIDEITASFCGGGIYMQSGGALNVSNLNFNYVDICVRMTTCIGVQFSNTFFELYRVGFQIDDSNVGVAFQITRDVTFTGARFLSGVANAYFDPRPFLVVSNDPTVTMAVSQVEMQMGSCTSAVSDGAGNLGSQYFFEVRSNGNVNPCSVLVTFENTTAFYINTDFAFSDVWACSATIGNQFFSITQALGSTPLAGGTVVVQRDAAYIQGTLVSNVAPTDTQVLEYNSGSAKWTPTARTINNTITDKVCSGSIGPVAVPAVIPGLTVTASSAGDYSIDGNTNILVDATDVGRLFVLQMFVNGAQSGMSDQVTATVAGQLMKLSGIWKASVSVSDVFDLRVSCAGSAGLSAVNSSGSRMRAVQET